MNGQVLDIQLRAAIVGIVKKAAQDAFENATEVWLTKKQLLAQFGMFSESWLKEYGHNLPVGEAIVTDEDGTVHHSAKAYPRNRIQRMIMSGEIKRFKAKPKN